MEFDAIESLSEEEIESMYDDSEKLSHCWCVIKLEGFRVVDFPLGKGEFHVSSFYSSDMHRALVSYCEEMKTQITDRDSCTNNCIIQAQNMFGARAYAFFAGDYHFVSNWDGDCKCSRWSRIVSSPRAC